MKPRSIIAPLLLIIAGAALLLHTLRPETPLWESIALYWPVILVLWGALRLLELFVWAWRGLPLPARGISGGEWAAIVLLCIAGSGLHVAYRYRPWERFGPLGPKPVTWFGRSYEFPIDEQRQAVPANPYVLLENLRGSVRIVGAGAAEVRVSGRKSVRALDFAAAKRADQLTPLETSVEAGRVVIRTNLDRIASEYRAEAELEVSVPRASTLELRLREGKVEVTGVDGAVELTSDRADAHLGAIGGPVRLNVRRSGHIRLLDIKGSVEVLGSRGRDIEVRGASGPVRIEGSYSGDQRFANLAKGLHIESSQLSLRIEQVGGYAELSLARLRGETLAGPIRFRSLRSHDVELENFTRGAEIWLESGDVRLRPALELAAIQVRTRTGDVELYLPEKAAFQLDARTARGSIENNFGAGLKQQSEGQGAALKGATGAGPLIRVETSRGRIVVAKDLGPLPVRAARGEKQPAAM